MPHKMKIDGLELEVADANSQSIIERAIASARKDGEDKVAAEKLRADTAEKAKTDCEKLLAAEKAEKEKLDSKVQAYDAKMMKCDECSGSGKVGSDKDCKGCDGSGKMKMDEFSNDDKRAAMLTRIWAEKEKVAVAKRVALLDEAKVLPTNLKLDEKSNLEIKALLVKKHAPSYKVDGKTEAQLDEALEVLRGQVAPKKVPTAIDQVRLVQDSDVVVENIDAPSDPDAARKAMIERSRKINSGKK